MTPSDISLGASSGGHHVVSSILVVVYSFIALYVTFQLWVVFKFHHGKAGYKAFFNYITLLWAIIRAIFWLTFSIDATIPGIIFYLLFWIPLALQFATFALLAVFLIKVVARNQWGDPSWKARVWTVFGVVVGAYSLEIFILCFCAAYLPNSIAADVEIFSSAFVFLFLAMLFFYLARRLLSLSITDFNRMFLFNPRVISFVARSICLVFISRSIFNFCSYAGVVSIDIDKDDVATDVSAAAVYFVWEIFPILLLLLTVTTVPAGLRRRYRAARSQMSSVGVFGAIQAARNMGESAEGEDNANLLDVSLSSPTRITSPRKGSTMGLTGLGAGGGLVASEFTSGANSNQLSMPLFSGNNMDNSGYAEEGMFGDEFDDSEGLMYNPNTFTPSKVSSSLKDSRMSAYENAQTQRVGYNPPMTNFNDYPTSAGSGQVYSYI